MRSNERLSFAAQNSELPFFMLDERDLQGRMISIEFEKLLPQIYAHIRLFRNATLVGLA